MNKFNNKNKLRALVEKNATKLEREKILNDFYKEISVKASIDLSQVQFESYEDSLSILKNGWPKLSEYIEDSSGLKSGYLDKHEISHWINKLIDNSELEFCYLLMVDKYKSIGALKLKLRDALESILPLIEMGEERICIISDNFKNSIYFEFDENDFDKEMDYFSLIQGDEWEAKFKCVI